MIRSYVHLIKKEKLLFQQHVYLLIIPYYYFLIINYITSTNQLLIDLYSVSRHNAIPAKTFVAILATSCVSRSLYF